MKGMFTLGFFLLLAGGGTTLLLSDYFNKPRPAFAADERYLNRYLDPNLRPQQIRYYAEDQPLLEHPWVTVPKAAGFNNQCDYILSTYPVLTNLPAAEQAAAIRAVKTHLPPILEQADGKTNPVYDWITEYFTLSNATNTLKIATNSPLLVDLYFHAQSPFKNGPESVRENIRTKLLDTLRWGISTNTLGLVAGDLAGEYSWDKIGRTYLLFELLEPDVLATNLTVFEKKTLNRTLQHSFYGYNGQIGGLGVTQQDSATILNKQVFVLNNLLTLASLFELQTVRYDSSYWPGFASDYHEQLRGQAAEIAFGFKNGLMGDGAHLYVRGCTQAYFYEGPQFVNLYRNWLHLWDDEDPLFQRADREIFEQMVSMGNYYEMTQFRVIEKDANSFETYSRAIPSEGKSFGNEIVNRDSDPHIFWAFANITGNRYICRGGPAVQEQSAMISNTALTYINYDMAAVWNPAVQIIEEGESGKGFRQDYLLWDRNTLGATGKFGNWAFHMIGRGLSGRRDYPEDTSEAFFQKDTFIGFVARNNGAPDNPETGLRTDHRMAHLFYTGIFPEKQLDWPEVTGTNVVAGYPPHYEDAHFSATVTDAFAVQGSIARAKDTEAYCRELWLATPDGALGLLRADVDRDPANGNSKAHFSFLLQGLLGANQTDHYLTKYGFDRVSVTNEIAYPSLTGDGNGFDFLNLRVRVLDQNFNANGAFSQLTSPTNFYPIDKYGGNYGIRGIWPTNDMENVANGVVAREVHTSATFDATNRPHAFVQVYAGDTSSPLTGSELTGLPGLSTNYLAFSASGGGRDYKIIFNPTATPLDLRSVQTFTETTQVRTFRSGARYRPGFLGNIEVNPEVDKEDEVVYGPEIQVPTLRPLNEACKILIPPYAHVAFVTGSLPATGGPGLEVRPVTAQWRFRDENSVSNTTIELTGRYPALAGGTLTSTNHSIRVASGSPLVTAGLGTELFSEKQGTIRFWVKPDASQSGTVSKLLCGGKALNWIIAWDRTGGSPGTLAVQAVMNGALVASRTFASGLVPDLWQQLVLTYSSLNPQDWTLWVNTAQRASQQGPGSALDALTNQVLRVGEDFAGEFRNLAVHDAALTSGEVFYLHDRELPQNFNRIRLTGQGGQVWVNGSQVVQVLESDFYVPGFFDTDKFTRFLKPGENTIAFEIERTSRASEIGSRIYIHGVELSADTNLYSQAWETVEVLRDDVESEVLAAYEAQNAWQKDALNTNTWDHESFRTPYYDRPWLDGSDSMSWGAMTWTPDAEKGQVWTMPVSTNGALHLLRFHFTINGNGVPQL